MPTCNAHVVIDFWFQKLEPIDWFRTNLEVDAVIAANFTKLHAAACRCELFAWRTSPIGRLAEIIVLDQFSRNIFRDSARAFEADNLALALAQETVQCGADQSLSVDQRIFVYMPYMHSESALIHEEAVQLFSTPGMEKNLEFEYKHKRIVDMFGRYPHRNEALGRQSTPEELAFLRQPESSF